MATTKEIAKALQDSVKLERELERTKKSLETARAKLKEAQATIKKFEQDEKFLASKSELRGQQRMLTAMGARRLLSRPGSMEWQLKEPHRNANSRAKARHVLKVRLGRGSNRFVKRYEAECPLEVLVEMFKEIEKRERPGSPS